MNSGRVNMADWKDFYEDNKEFRGQYLDSLAERLPSAFHRCLKFSLFPCHAAQGTASTH